MLDYISADTIVLTPRATDRDSMIRELVALGVATGQVADADLVVQSALEREALMTTAVGDHIAIPHAKCDGVNRPMVAFAKARDIDWNSPGGDLARIVFLIAVPKADAGDEHLRILANLSRALIEDDFREALLTASTKDDVLGALRAFVSND